MSEDMIVVILGVVFGAIEFYLIFKFTRFLQRKFGKNRYEKPVKIKKKKQDKKNALYSERIIHEEQGSRKCSKCGNEIEDGMIFCDKCGSRIN